MASIQIYDNVSEASYPGVERALQETPLVLVPLATTKKPKIQQPQDTIDEFWAKFSTKAPSKAFTILPKNIYAQKAGENVPKGKVKGQNALASYEEAAAICKAKVEKIVKECRRVNQKYRDPHFDIEFDLKWGKRDCLSILRPAPKKSENDDDEDNDDGDDSNFWPGSVKRVGDIFDNPQFYVAGPTSGDIRQGNDGDCWFLAALTALSNKPGLIERVCVARDEKVGVYGFVFHRDGEWRSEIIDDKLYLSKADYDESFLERILIEDRQRINSEEDYRKVYQSGSGALYFAQCSDENETWLPLLEKAYAKAHGDYAAIEGGFTGEGLEDLTGGVTTEVFSTDILDKDYFWKEELLKVNDEFLFGCATGIFGGWGDRKGIYEGHAYSIMRAVEIDGQRLCLLRNPWGMGEWNGPWSDGSKEWTPEWMQKLDHRFGNDGAFWISYEDLLKKYQTFDRTRLFSPEWKVTQQWTSLEVPWTVDYNNTKFSFTLEKTAPVVIVLSQLDDRYFKGLSGQYAFRLSFRIHKAGEEDYIVRSHGNYWMSRSVTAELELDAGEYDVLLKIEAMRDQDLPTVEQMVRDNAKSRRDKLLRIGLAYDLAHAKGKITETNEEKKARKAQEAKQKAKERKSVKEKLTKEKQKRKHNENREKRKQLKEKEKRKAKEAAKAQKKKEKKEEEEKAKAAKEQENKAEKKDDSGNKEEEKPANTEQAAPEKEATETPAVVVSDTSTNQDEKAPEDKAADKETKEPESPETVTEEPTTKTIEAVQPTSTPETAEESESDDDSDINSEISDISEGVIDDELESMKLDTAAQTPAPPTTEAEPDEFERDPWNAIIVVGLRVYSKNSDVSVKIVRPNKWENGESKLDVDDSAADATKGTEKAEKAESKAESEGSGVLV
ncbi:hypothetical protein F5884DRAFT_677059 [Xylogone sp. PMI_703]|nr:hypothetical protein F5884DRAFT_677059 [Xylogone sp. PMI_703]